MVAIPTCTTTSEYTSRSSPACWTSVRIRVLLFASDFIILAIFQEVTDIMWMWISVFQEWIDTFKVHCRYICFTYNTYVCILSYMFVWFVTLLPTYPLLEIVQPSKCFDVIIFQELR